MPADWDRVVELARISMENPAAAAVLRRHCPDSGDCEECRRLGGGDGPGCSWPCPTVLAIEEVAARPKPIVFDPEALKQVQVPVGPWQREWEWPSVVLPAELPGHPLVKPGPVADEPAPERTAPGESSKES